MQILIVDDSETDRMIVRRYLKSYRFTFYDEELGRDGVERCREIEPDCILLDFNLPDMNGVEFLDTLAEYDGYIKYPVVVLTGDGDETKAVAAMQHGASDYLSKDRLSTDLLYRTVQNAVEKHRMQRKLIEERERVNTELERMVAERTQELSKANARLAAEIGERQKIEVALRTSEEKYRTLFNIFPLGISISDSSGKLVEANWLSEQILGLSITEQTNRYIDGTEWKIIRPDGTPMPAHEYASTMALKEHRIVAGVEKGIVKGDKTTWINVVAAPLDLPGYGVVIAYIDITERFRANERMKASLLEKEILLKEIHHRVKNNLQIISSLLHIQSGYIKDPVAQATFKESENRVKSMALIHEKLYSSKDLGKINFTDYLASLTANLFRSYGVDPAHISLELKVSIKEFALDSAIPCGLIINELVSNSLKYAFPKARGGKISIKLECSDTNDVILTVADNGIGFPPDLDFSNAKTLGLQLVGLLAKQLEGSIELDSSDGTSFRLCFRPASVKNEFS